MERHHASRHGLTISENLEEIVLTGLDYIRIMATTNFDIVIMEYMEKKRRYERTYLGVEFESEKRFFPMKTRYTQIYENYVYAYLKPLENMQLRGFVTLTVPSKGGYDDLERQIDIVRKKWKGARSILSRHGCKLPYYLRSYEIGKNLNFHVHIAFFGEITDRQIVEMLKYWSRNVGFVKGYLYEDHRRKYNDITEKWTMSALQKETWVREKEDSVNILLREKGRVNVGSKVINYVFKYTVKQPSEVVQALMSYYKIRTFSCSRNLQKYLNIFRERYKEENKEDLGEVKKVTMYNVDQGKEILIHDNLAKKIFNKMVLDRYNSSYIIELEKAYEHYEVLKYKWYYIVEGVYINSCDP